MDERQMKICLLEYLKNDKNTYDLIGSEIPYNHRKRRLDILALQSGKTFVFEIKSDKDSTKRLEGQVEDYIKSFNHLYLVCTMKHLSHVRNFDKKIGIILIDDNKVKMIRKAHMIVRLNKSYLVSLFKVEELRMMLKRIGIYHNNRKSSELRDIIVDKLTIKDLTELSYESLITKYYDRYLNFQIGLGQYITKEDLAVLTMSDKLT